MCVSWISLDSEYEIEAVARRASLAQQEPTSSFSLLVFALRYILWPAIFCHSNFVPIRRLFYGILKEGGGMEKQ
jgi:hypothetical protein